MKRVASRERAVRPLRDAGGTDQLPTPREIRAPAFRVVHLDPVACSERGREFRAGDRTDRQDGLLLRRQALDLALDQLPERLGHARRHIRHGCRQLPAFFDRPNVSLPDEIVDHVHQEQRIAARVAVERTCEPRRERRVRKAPVEILLHGRLAQEVERDLFALSVQDSW